jgi:hypothetical protein
MVGKVRECYVESWHLQGCSPRLCRLRTNGLAPVSKYWTYRSHAGDMGPVSLVACHQQKLSFSLLLHWLAWEKNWVWTRGSVIQRALDCVGSPFSQEQWDPSKSIDDSWKVATYGDCLQEAYVNWHGKRTSRVDRVFPYMVCIDSNRRNSRIWVPLVCGSHHVVN